MNYEIEAASQFEKAMDDIVFTSILNDLIDYGIFRYHKRYSHKYRDTDFVLYQKYTKSDVCRLLNWEKNQNPQNVGGDDIVDSQKYKDKFVSSSELISILKHGRNFNSPEMKYFYSVHTAIYLFKKAVMIKRK